MDYGTIGIEISKYASGILVAIVAKLAYDGSKWGKRVEPSYCSKHDAVELKIGACVNAVEEVKPLVSKIFDILREISNTIAGIEKKVAYMDGKGSVSATEINPLLCLVVDDNQDILNTVCQNLENASCGDIKCVGAQKINDAKEHLTQTSFDLAIIDYYIGTDLGYELYKFIKTSYPKIKCLIYSAKNPATIESDIAEIYIEKPFPTKDLLKKIETIL